MEKLEIVSRLQNKAIDTPDVQVVEVGAIAGEVRRQLREMADSRGVDIRIEANLPTIAVDVARLELILVNLVSNAVKYGDPQKRQRFVAIESGPSDDGSFCTLVVRDNGLGIPESSLGSIFERFVRVHAERDRELGVRGSGLGLAIVADCVDAIGGRIAIDSKVGEGTSVRVTIPRQAIAGTSDNI
jgi:signal transduction histidine kinase